MGLQRPFVSTVVGTLVAAVVLSSSIAVAESDRANQDDYYVAQAEPDAPEVAPADEPVAVEEPDVVEPELPIIDEKGSEKLACDCGTARCGCGTWNAYDKKAAAAYKGVFYDNDFSYLCDPCYDDWHLGERFKRRCVGDHLILDAGGEYRLRYQNENNLRGKPLSSTTPSAIRNDDFWLQRTRLYLNAEYGGWLRGYAEAIDATSDGQRHPPRFIENNRFDALNLFAEAKLPGSGCGPEVWIRGGRQELLYGAQRLISPLDWSNTRRTFDGLKMYLRGDTWDIDGFWTRPVPFAQHLPTDTNFDSSNDQEEFVGLYAKYKGRPGTDMEFYFLRLANYSGAIVGEDLLPGDSDPNTFGMRLGGDWCGLLWAFEGGYQFGNFANDNIEAGFWTVGLGRKFSDVCLTPTLWLYYDWASGDADPTDGQHGTFNQYFPLGHKYLGWMDIIGRQNIEDLNLLLTLQPHERVKFLMWYHMFWLEQSRDALYNVGGAPIYRDPTGSSGDEVGSELDLLVQWDVTPRVNLWFGYSHFFAGDYFSSPVIQGGGPLGRHNGDDADFFYTQMSVRF